MKRHRGHGDGVLHETGLICFPLFPARPSFRPFDEMKSGRIVPDAGSETSGQPLYQMEDLSSLTTFVIRWDAALNFFAAVEYVRRGLPQDLLERVREKTELTSTEKHRLRTERVVVGTGCYKYSDFENNTRAGIHFPRKMSLHRKDRGCEDERNFTINKWEANLEMPEMLFKPNFPEDTKIIDSPESQ